MICSNCLSEEKIKHVPGIDNFYTCTKCSVTYAKNRRGITFSIQEEVNIQDFHPKTNMRIFTIAGIFIHEECESGRMIYLIDKETQKPLKTLLDTNWLIKI